MVVKRVKTKRRQSRNVIVPPLDGTQGPDKVVPKKSDRVRSKKKRH
jgi:hypothetical protein